MNFHCPLAVPAQYDLRIRAVVRCLAQQVCSRLGSSRVTANQITANGSRIVYTLHSNIVCSNQFGEMVEERRANIQANVTELNRTPCENDGDRLASNASDISELIALDIPVILSFADGCTGGACLLVISSMGNVDGGGADA